MAHSLKGRQTSQDHRGVDAHGTPVLADDSPAAMADAVPQGMYAAGEQAPPAANAQATPTVLPLLADPLLRFAADVVDDLERVRIANENRLRQLTRTATDKDGEERGYGLMPPDVCEADDKKLIEKLVAVVGAASKQAQVSGKPLRVPPGWHPDVWNLCLIILSVQATEHRAILDLQRKMRAHPLGPWMKAAHGIGEKQGARLLAVIGDPYIRPEIVRADGTVEPSRPRKGPAELWAFCGYHVIRTPVSGHDLGDTQSASAADGSSLPADQRVSGTHPSPVGGELNGHSGHARNDTQPAFAGVAPKRARGQKANWSGTAKMRAHLVAVSCMKCMDSPYRKVYDDAREKYAEAVHDLPCPQCGPKGQPAQPGTPLSDGHKHHRALRAVAKEVLEDLWREAKRLHEETST
jgi:hypothetical protein